MCVCVSLCVLYVCIHIYICMYIYVCERECMRIMTCLIHVTNSMTVGKVSRVKLPHKMMALQTHTRTQGDFCICTHTYTQHSYDEFNERCRSLTHEGVWRSHVTHMNEPRRTHEWVTSHMWTSHVTRVNESRHTPERVVSHMWTSHVTHVNTSRHTHEWVTPHMWTSHVTLVNDSRHTHKWVTPHMWTRPSHTWTILWSQHRALLHMNKSCHTCERVMWHTRMSQVTHVNESHHKNERVAGLNAKFLYIRMSHVTHGTSHVTQLNATFIANADVMSYMWFSHIYI